MKGRYVKFGDPSLPRDMTVAEWGKRVKLKNRRVALFPCETDDGVIVAFKRLHDSGAISVLRFGLSREAALALRDLLYDHYGPGEGVG